MKAANETQSNPAGGRQVWGTCGAEALSQGDRRGGKATSVTVRSLRLLGTWGTSPRAVRAEVGWERARRGLSQSQ